MNSDQPMTVEFYCHVRDMMTIHRSVNLEFHGDLQLPCKPIDVKIQGCTVRAYSHPAPQAGIVVYPWGDGSAAAAPYEDGANVLVDAELVPFVRADFGNRITLWYFDRENDLVRS